MPRRGAALRSAALALLAAGTAPSSVLQEPVPWHGSGGWHSIFAADPCGQCSEADVAAITAAARTTGLAGRGSAACTAEVRDLLCAAWCTPLRRRYTDEAGPCDAVLQAPTSVAVCPARCVALSGVCRAPICGTALGPFAMVREEGGGDCSGELLLSEDGSIAPAAFDIRLSHAVQGDVAVSLSGAGTKLVARPLPSGTSPAAAMSAHPAPFEETVELTFTTENWDVAQRIAVRGNVDDEVAWDGIVHAGQALALAVTERDFLATPYSSLVHTSPPLPSFAVLDDDFAGLSVAPAALHTREGLGQLELEAAAAVCTAAAGENACDSAPGCEWAGGECNLSADGRMAVLLAEISAEVEGVTDQYQVGPLATQPSGQAVMIDITGPAAGGLQFFPTQLVFNESNWDEAQTVSVWATDNKEADGSRELAITHAVRANSCVAVDGSLAAHVALCGGIDLSGGNAASRALCEAPKSPCTGTADDAAVVCATAFSDASGTSAADCPAGCTYAADEPACRYSSDAAYVEHATCLGDSLTVTVGVEDDEQSEVYTSAVARPVAAAACLSGSVIPAGTLAECRAFDGAERCCSASKDDEIGAAIRGLFPAGGSGSPRCRQLTQFFLCGTQCSAQQAAWSALDAAGNMTVTICDTFCDRVADACGVPCLDALGGLDPGEIVIQGSVTSYHATNTSYRAYATRGGCFGGGVFVDENDSDGASFDVHLTSRPLEDVQLTSADSDAAVAASTPQAITFAPEYSTDDVPYFEERSVLVTPVDNEIDGGGFALATLSQSTASADAAYAGRSWEVDVCIFDDDHAGLVIKAPNATGTLLPAPAGEAVLSLDQSAFYSSRENHFYTVELSAQPSAPVTWAIDPTEMHQLHVRPRSVTFTAANWDVPQVVSVYLVADTELEGQHSSSIWHEASSADIAYDGLRAGRDVEIFDHALQINATELPIAEGGFETLTVRMHAAPAATMAVTIEGEELAGLPSMSVQPPSLTFGPDDYDVEQTIRVFGAADDQIDYGDSRRRLTFSLTETPGLCREETTEWSDASAGGLELLAAHHLQCGAGDAMKAWRYVTQGSEGRFVYTCCRLTVQPMGTCVDEQTTLADGTGRNLDSLAAHDVACGAGKFLTEWTLSSSPPDIQITYKCCAAAAPMDVGACAQRSTDELVSFTYAPLSGFVDDEGNLLEQHSASTVPDCEVACSAASCESFAFDSATSTCFLYDMVITVDSALDGAASATLISHYKNFGTPNLVPHGVGGCAANELLTQWRFENPASETAAMSYTCCVWSKPGYRAQRQLPVNLQSNDRAAVVVTPRFRHQSLRESGWALFGVQLASVPRAPVTVALDFPGTDGATATPATLTFDSTTWNVPSVVTVQAHDNLNPDGSRTTFMVAGTTSSDPVYGRSTALPAAVDHAGCTPGAESCDPFEPIAPVCAEGHTFIHECAARVNCVNAQYAGECDSRGLITAGLTVVPVEVRDDDTSGVHVMLVGTQTDCEALGGDSKTFVECGGSCVPRGDCAIQTIAGSEDGQTDSLVFKLMSQPTSSVYVTIANPPSNEQVTFTNATGTWSAMVLAFGPADWDVPQTVLVSCVDDLVDEAEEHIGQVLVGTLSEDAAYNEAPHSVANVTITDNDVALVSVYAPFATVGVLEGTQLSYKLWLETKPTQPVTVDVHGSQVDVQAADGQLVPSAQFVFTPDTWGVPQEVLIQATDDFDIERTDDADNIRNHIGTLQHTVSSTDPFYDSAARAETCALPTGLPVFVRVVDNDEPRVFMSKLELSVEEGGANDIYIMKLLSRPVADVYFDLQYDAAAVAVEPRTVVFAASGWDPSRQVVVTVTAVDDSREQVDTIEEIPGIQTTTLIGHRVRTADPFYGSEAERSEIEPPPVTVTIGDNDFSAVLLDRADNTIVVRENGMLDSYTIQLATQPASPVVLQLWPGNRTEAMAAGHQIFIANSELNSSAEFVFTKDTWNVSQQVFVAAVDDGVQELMCSPPDSQTGPVLEQLIRHFIVTEDEKYLPGCGRNQHDCTVPGNQFATLGECQQACTAPYDPLQPAEALSEMWCGGCLRIYDPSTDEHSCPPVVNGSALPPRCWKYEARQGIFYEGDAYPTLEDDEEQFNFLQERRNEGDYSTRWAVKAAYVVDDDSSLLSNTEQRSDISERGTTHDWSVLSNVTLYAGIPSQLGILSADHCGLVVKTEYDATFRVSTSDRFMAPRIANGSNAPLYTADVVAGPVSTIFVSVELVVGDFSAQIRSSPIFVRVLPGPAHPSYSYVTGLGSISTADIGQVRIFWMDKFGAPTDSICRPTLRHTLPLTDFASSDCRKAEAEHGAVFSVSFLDTTGGTIPSDTFSASQRGYCHVPPEDTTREECLTAQAGGTSTVVSFGSAAPGSYLLQVALDGVPISGSAPGFVSPPSPYPFTVTPGPTAITECYAVGLGASDARAGEQTVFTIKLADEFGNVKSPLDSDPVAFECLLTSQATSYQVDGVVSPQDDGYICVYSVEVAGPYLISVTAEQVVVYNDQESTSTEHISGSPMSLDVKPAPPDSDFYLVKSADDDQADVSRFAVAGTAVLFQVRAMDQFMNPSTAVCNATVCATVALPHVSRATLVSGVEIEETVAISAAVSGSYPVEFTPTIAGVSRVEVVVGGIHVPQSPFEIVVSASGLDPSKTEVVGGGTEGGVARYISSFTVRLNDQYGNRLDLDNTTQRLQAGVLRAQIHCFNVTNDTDIPSPTALGVQDEENCTSQDSRITVPEGCSESWENATAACEIPIDCIGFFHVWGECADFAAEEGQEPRTCGFGTRKRHYVITREAQNGGYECDYDAGDVWEEACAIEPCMPQTTCVDSDGNDVEVVATDQGTCELLPHTWAPGSEDPTCAATHLAECADAGITSQEACEAAAGGSGCTWDGSACAATDEAGCTAESLNGEDACLGAGVCTYTEDGACTADADSSTVDVSTQRACERSGNTWACLEHCEAECSLTGLGMTGVPGEPSVDRECLRYFSWQTIPPDTRNLPTCIETATVPVAEDTAACAAIAGADLDTATACEAVLTDDTTDAADAKACTYTPAPTRNTTLAACEATHLDACAAETASSSCGAAAGGSGACSWMNDATCRASDTVPCRGETARALSLDSIAEDGEAACLEAGECSYLEGTANVTAVPLPYRQMWCVYCYEITHSTPVTVIQGDVQEFQYRVNTPGEWEVIIVLTVNGEEAFHYHNLATILPLADAVANATTSTIENLEAASVNNTFAFYLQARTWQGINLVRGGDPFEVKFHGQTLSASSDQITYVVNGTRSIRAWFEDSGDGKYLITVWTDLAGTFAIVPSLDDGDDADMGEYFVDVLPGDTDPEESIVAGRTVDYAGQEMTIDILARDVFGNDQVYSQFDGPDPFQLAAAGPGPVDLALQDYNTGLYRAKWTGTVAGMYTINITLHSTPIFGSPVRVEIGAAPVSGRVSSASGVGLGAGGLDADTPTSFGVQLRDAYGNRGTLVPELMHVSLLGLSRDTHAIPLPAVRDPPTIDEDYQLTLETEFATLLACDEFRLRADTTERSLLNATVLGVIAAYTKSSGQWVSIEVGDGVHMSFAFAHVTGIRLVFRNSSVTDESGARSLPSGIHASHGLEFSCASSIGAQLVAAAANSTDAHQIYYHATIAGDYNLRIDYGRELITNTEYAVTVHPGEFNESASSSSIPFVASAQSLNGTLSGSISDANPLLPRTVAGRETEFSVTLRDSYSNELTGGDGIMSATLKLSRPLTVLRMEAQNSGGQYTFTASPTRIGIYELDVKRMGVVLPSMSRLVVVVPAEPYGPNCELEKGTGTGSVTIVDRSAPITGLVHWHIQGYPELATVHSFVLNIVLYDAFGNPIDVPLNETGFQVNVTATSDDPVVLEREPAGVSTMDAPGQLVYSGVGNPVEIRASTHVAGTYRLALEFIAPDNTSSPILGSPFTLEAQPRECVGAWSQFAINRDSDAIAGEVFEIGLTVIDAFQNPCTLDILESSVETVHSLKIKAERKLETPDEEAARLASEQAAINAARQAGRISAVDDGAILFMQEDRIQWLDAHFVMQEVGSYLFSDIPTVVGAFGFEVTANNATLWVGNTGLGVTASALTTDEQIDELLGQVGVTVRPGPASPYRSFLSSLEDTIVETETKFFVHTMDQFDNHVDNDLATICTRVNRIDAPVPSSADEAIFLSAPPVEAAVVPADTNMFNVTIVANVSGTYEPHVFVFAGRNLDCSVLLAEQDDRDALKPMLASVCPVPEQTFINQLTPENLCTLPLALAYDVTVFNLLDTDGSGAIQWAEFMAGDWLLVGEEGSSADNGYGTAMLEVFDSNGNDQVSFGEFAVRWSQTMSLPPVLIYPGDASVLTSNALGNGLRGGFQGDQLRFEIEVRDRFGNLRSYSVRDELAVFMMDVNATAQSNILGAAAPVWGIPTSMPDGCQVDHCVHALAQLNYQYFNDTYLNPTAELLVHSSFTEMARVIRQFDAGIYTTMFTPSDTNVYHACIFINGQRLPVSRCEFFCSPKAVILTEELEVPTLQSVADAKDLEVRAGTALSFEVQLRNEIGYDINFGGYMGALIVGVDANITMCSSQGVLGVACEADWISSPFAFEIMDIMDGSYIIEYTPTNPGVFNLAVMLNLTHESLPVIGCTPGLLTCQTVFLPVCGHDLRTYPNECFAANNCIDVAYDGECIHGQRVPIPWLENPITEFTVVVLPAGTSPEHTVISLVEIYMCPLGYCERLKTLRATDAAPPRHVGLSARRTYCDSQDADLSMHRCPGQTFEFQLQARDVYGNVPEYRPRDESFAGTVVGPVPVEFDTWEDGGNGTYFFSTQLTISGDYIISLTMNGVDVGASSFWLTLDPPHFWVPETSLAVSGFTSFVAGETASVFLRPRGQYGNALYSEPAPGPLAAGSVMINFDPPTIYTKAVLAWNRHNGTVQVAYTVRRAGSYTYNISFFREPFALNTLSVVVVAGRAVASECTAYGDGLANGIAGAVDRQVFVEARDGYGNLVTEPDGIEVFTVQVDHMDARVYDFWGKPVSWRPVHTHAVYVASLASYTPPLYTYTYTALPAGIYSSLATLGAPDVSGETNVPYRTDVMETNAFSFVLNLASAPLIARCQFQSTGAHIELEFDRETNKGREPQPDSCTRLIDTAAVAQFGTGSSCRWLDASTILIELGSGASILVGDTIAVKTETILALDENSHPSSASAVLAIPPNMPAPTVSLAAPTTLGQCDDLLLDASGSFGSGGRPMGYVWTALAGVGANLAAVYEVLHLASCEPGAELPCNQAVVSADTLVSGKSYTFTVAVTNFWGSTSSATVDVYKSADPTPRVVIAGPTTKVVRSSDVLKLRSDVELSGCYNGDAQMSFEWSLVPGSPAVDLPAAFVNSREIALPKGSLQAGQTYGFNFRGSMDASPWVQANAQVQVVVSFSSFDFEIVGGSRTAPNSRDVEIQTFIADPEDAELDHSVSYEWRCVPLVGSDPTCATSQAYYNLLSTSADVLVLPANLLPSAAYRFTVTATKDPGIRSAEFSAVITLVDDPILDVFIERQLPVGVSEATFSTSDRLILNRKVFGNTRATECTWSVDGELNLDATGVLGTTRTSSQLVVRPGHLTEPSYTFRVSCTEISPGDAFIVASGSAQYSITVNSPPASGTLRLKDPATHLTLTAQLQVAEQVEISAENWVDDSAHHPLTFEFRKAHPSAANHEVVLAKSTSPTIVARLPAGKQSDGFAVNVVVYISDRFGATARAEVSTIVYTVDPGDELEKAQQLMTGGFSDAKKTGDVRELLQLCTVVGDLLVAGAGNRRRLQVSVADQQAIVTDAIDAVSAAASSVPLDPSLVAQFFSGLVSTTAVTAGLTPSSVQVALTLVDFLLDESAVLSIAEATATDALTALQNMLHAVLLYTTDDAPPAPWASVTADPADAANVQAQSLMAQVDDLVVRVGLALLPSVQCGESPLSVAPAANSAFSDNEKWSLSGVLFEMSAVKLCVTPLEGISVAHTSSRGTLGSADINVATSVMAAGPVDTVTTVFYDSMHTPSELPNTVMSYSMANLSSPVVSTRFYAAGNELTFGTDFAYGELADVYVVRGDWAYDDPPETTTLCGYFDASTQSWESCEVVTSDHDGTVCRCPVLSAVTTLRNSSMCIANTDCFTCLANPSCGWCPGYPSKFSGAIPGAPGYCFEGNLQAEFYPGTCGETPWGTREAVAVGSEINSWSYDSCPCEAFKSCGDCMLDNDPFSGKTKRECGYCPQTEKCIAAVDDESCSDWYINFITGMQEGTKPGVTPADGGIWQVDMDAYDVYPANCPLNCSIDWGVANGYEIAGCTSGECVDFVNCVCEPGYWSPDCSRMCPGGSSNPCGGNGQCDAGAMGSGTCFCNPGFGGADCSDCDSGHWGPQCVNDCNGGGDTPCSGNGICASGQAGTGECTCFRGYYGIDCSSHCPGATDYPQRICAGNGNCDDGPDGNGQCSCWAGFYGQGCAGECPRPGTTASQALQTANEICAGSARGVCSDGATGSGVCDCLPSFWGESCEFQCPGSTPSGNESCTGRGVCSDGAGGSGQCSCLDGYQGSTCEELPTRVRVWFVLGVSWEEYTLYDVASMFVAGLASTLEVGEEVLLPITQVVGDETVTVYLEILSKGYDAAACAQNAARCPAGFATDVLARLTALSASDLIESISLPVASYDHETHIGEDWLCGGNVTVPQDPDARPPLNGEPQEVLCNNHGSCNETMGTCVCDAGYAGVDCVDELRVATRPPVLTAQEAAATWMSENWWLVVVLVLCAGLMWFGWRHYHEAREYLKELGKKPLGEEAAEARHWMSLRRMATGRDAGEAFIVGGGGHTTGASARSIWDITLRASTPEDEDYDGSRPPSVAREGGWLAAFPGPTQSVGSRSIVARERSDNSLALADRARAERTERLADRVPQPPARPPRPLPRAPAGRRRTVR